MGVQVLVTKSSFEEFVERCRELQLCAPSCPSSGDGGIHSERLLFQQLLQACASQPRAILAEHCNKEHKQCSEERHVALLHRPFEDAQLSACRPVPPLLFVVGSVVLCALLESGGIFCRYAHASRVARSYLTIAATLQRCRCPP